MYRAIALVFIALLAGCAGPGLRDYQASCESKHSGFQEFSDCFKAEVSNDRHTKGDSRVKLLLLRTDQIAERVRDGRFSELDAKVEFQQEYVRLRESALTEDAAAKAASGSTTTCVAKGNKVKCSPY